jgi:hypothetical protein
MQSDDSAHGQHSFEVGLRARVDSAQKSNEISHGLERWLDTFLSSRIMILQRMMGDARRLFNGTGIGVACQPLKFEQSAVLAIHTMQALSR